MSLKTLDLGAFSVVNSAESLKLEVVSAAEIRGPRSISHLKADNLAKALVSRQLWVSRGRGCRIDIEVLLDGKPLNRNHHFELLESLGCQIRDSKPWNHLLLSTSLDILPELSSPNTPQLSVHLNNCIKPPEHERELAAWIGDNDVIPPPGVLCVELESVRVQFSFSRILQDTIAKATQPPPTELDSFDPMLLDISPDRTPLRKDDILGLDQAVEVLKALPSQIKDRFEIPTPLSLDGPLPLENIPHFPQHTENRPKNGDNDPLADLSKPIKMCDTLSKSSRRISKHAVNALESWIASHQGNLYPTREERENLMVDTGLTKSQVKNQFVGYRRKLKAQLASGVLIKGEDEEMLLVDSSGNVGSHIGLEGDEMMLDRDIDVVVEDDEVDRLLFSQTSQFTSSLHSQSTQSSGSTTTNIPMEPDDVSQRKFYVESTRSSVGSILPLRLADAAFRKMMGAIIPRRETRLYGVEREDRPQLTMSTLVPSMFSLGFKNSMAGNSRFLPAISHAFTTSLPQRVQTPSLRRKLLQLSNIEPSRLGDTDEDSCEPGTTNRLSSVVQSRLWGMMQRRLFDPSASNKVWRQSIEGDVEVEDVFEDMLGATDGYGSQLKIDEDHDMFDDELLFSDDEDDDLLFVEVGNFLDRAFERRAIEQDTENMLIGDEGWRHRHDSENGDGDLLGSLDEGNSIILLDESENDEMLI